MSTTPAALTALTLESLIVLAGLWLLWRHFFARGTGPSPLADAGRLPRWELPTLDMGVFLWLVLCGGFVLQVAGLLLLNALGVKDPARQVIAGSFFQAGMLAGCVGFARTNAAARRSFDFPRPRAFLGAGLATFLMAVPPVFALGFGWQALLGAFGVPVEQQDMIGLFRNADNLPQLGFMIALAGLMAPLTEELVFRAGIFRFLHGRVPRWSALLLSAVFFGVIHVNLASCPQLILLGLVFALSYERTGNLAVPMLAHALFNLNTILLILAGIDT